MFYYASSTVVVLHGECAVTPDIAPATDERVTPAPILRLTLIGEMDARSSTGVSVLPRVRKTRGLFAVLALSAPRLMLRSGLAGLLWSTRGREQARGSLRQAVHDLSAHLEPLGGDLLRADREHVGLQEEALWIDAREVARATVASPDALGLLRRPLAEDLTDLDPAFDRWLTEERQRLVDGARAVAEALLAMAIEPASRLEAAEKLLAIDRTHEGAWRAVMEAHVATGEGGLALEAFERCSMALRETVNTIPSAETFAVVERIRAPRSLGGRRPSLGSAARKLVVTPSTEPSPSGVRLGVLAFQELGSGQTDGFAEALAEEITNALARFRWIFLLSSSSIARLTGGANWAPSSDTLELDFVLDGTVQRVGGRVRILARLLDLHADGEVIWARRFDRPSGDLLALQDEIAAGIVAQVDPELLMREGSRVRARAAVDPTAYQLLLQAIPQIYRLERATFIAAGTQLAAAASLDPGHAAVHAWWAYWHVFLVGEGWASDAAGALAWAEQLAERALSLDPKDARALTLVGHVRAFLHRRIDEAIALHERALELNPNLPIAWLFSGLALTYAGQAEEGINRIEQAKRLSPLDPLTYFFDMGLMLAHLLEGAHSRVVEIGLRALELNPTFASTVKVQLSALGHLGRMKEAKIMLTRLLMLEPGMTVRVARSRAPMQQAEDVAMYIDGLRLGGLVEG